MEVRQKRRGLGDGKRREKERREEKRREEEIVPG
jgi:hypothetical protein